MKNLLFSVVVGVLIAAVCPAGAQPLAKPDVLHEESIMTDQRLSRYDTIIIREFATGIRVLTQKRNRR